MLCAEIPNAWGMLEGAVRWMVAGDWELASGYTLYLAAKATRTERFPIKAKSSIHISHQDQQGWHHGDSKRNANTQLSVHPLKPFVRWVRDTLKMEPASNCLRELLRCPRYLDHSSPSLSFRLP